IDYIQDKTVGVAHVEAEHLIGSGSEALDIIHRNRVTAMKPRKKPAKIIGQAHTQFLFDQLHLELVNRRVTFFPLDFIGFHRCSPLAFTTSRTTGKSHLDDLYRCEARLEQAAYGRDLDDGARY